MPGKKIKVLIADDHAIVRMGLRALLDNEEDIAVVGEVRNGKEAVRETINLTPDIVIMDLMMPLKDGATAVEELAEMKSPAKVLILTSFSTSDNINRALTAGAAGAILKNVENTAVITAIRTIAAGKTFIHPDIRRLIKEDPPTAALSTRQQEILRSLMRGLTNLDIAQQLGISNSSVKTHIEALYAKLGASGRSEAVAIALRKHLLKI